MLAIFHANAKPRVREHQPSIEFSRKKLAQASVTLGEYLISVPGRGLHHATNLRDLLGWNVLVKQVAHRVNEDAFGNPPLERDFQLLGNQSQIKSLLERMTGNPAKSLGEGLCIAVLASGADLGASANRIPGCIGPLYGTVFAHRVRNLIKFEWDRFPAFFRRRSGGRTIHPNFRRFHYPWFWHYDILGGLEAMAEMRLVRDPRCADALELLERKELPNADGPRKSASTDAPHVSRAADRL